MPLNIYRYTFTATCPVDGAAIEYRIHIEADSPIKAEQIVAECTFNQSEFHEGIADLLFEKLGGRQVLTATHTGVEIETRRGP
jgi:hypothetical protein